MNNHTSPVVNKVNKYGTYANCVCFSSHQHWWHSAVEWQGPPNTQDGKSILLCQNAGDVPGRAIPDNTCHHAFNHSAGNWSKLLSCPSFSNTRYCKYQFKIDTMIQKLKSLIQKSWVDNNWNTSFSVDSSFSVIQGTRHYSWN